MICPHCSCTLNSSRYHSRWDCYFCQADVFCNSNGIPFLTRLHPNDLFYIEYDFQEQTLFFYQNPIKLLTSIPCPKPSISQICKYFQTVMNNKALL